MKLYDDLIKEIQQEFSSAKPEPFTKIQPWQLQEKEDLVLKSDMAYEFGGGNAFAVSGILFTTNKSLVPDNSVVCLNSEEESFSLTPEEDINYARIVIVRLKESAIKNRTNQQLYAIFRKLEYQRYHSFLKGVGTRVSSMQNREVLRISKSAKEECITTNKMAAAFLQSFLDLDEVEKVQVLMAVSRGGISENLFNSIKNHTQKADFVTNSLNEIFKGLKMDCSVCGQKSLCDEISGLKELHKSVT